MIRKTVVRSVSPSIFNALVFLFLALICSTTVGRAQTAIWSGGAGSEWNTAGSWDIGVPGVGTNAIIRVASVNYNNPMTAASFKTLALSNALAINTSGFFIDEAGASSATITVFSNSTLTVAANQGLTVSNSAGTIAVNNGGNIVLNNNAFLLVTNSSGSGTFNVGTSGNPQFGGTFTINSGATATIDKTLNVAGVPSRVFVNGGTLNCLAGSRITENNTDGSQRIAVSSGTVNLGDFSVTRCSNPAGLLVTNGVVNATAIQIGTANSTACSIIQGGIVTNSGTFTISDTTTITASGDRRSQFFVKGGTVVSTSPNGIIIANQSNTDSGPSASGSGLGGVLNVSGGTVIAEKLTLIKDNTIVNAYAGFFLSGSGSIYLGSGGFVRNSGATHIGTAVVLTGGTIGAIADWSSSAAMGLTNTVTFRAADSAGTAHNISLSGSLNGAGTLSKTGTGKLTLSGNNNYTGGTAIGAGTLALASSTGLPRGDILTIGSSGNAATFDLAGFSPLLSSLAVGSGATAASQIITNSSGTASTLTFSNSLVNSTYSGKISGGNPINITVLAGTLTCSGQNNYPGNLFISNGRLTASGAGSTFSGSSIVLSNAAATLDVSGMSGLTLTTGQSLVGYGVVIGNVTATNCPITPGANGIAGTLSISNNLTLNGNVTNQFDLVLDPNSTANDQIIVGGALNISGTNVIKLNPLAGSLIEGTYHLIVASSVGSGDATNFQISGSPGTGLQAIISVTASGVDLIISAANGAERVWVGDGTANLWDVAFSTNWLKAGLPDVYTNGNFVVFDDTATNQTVNLVGALLPADITVDSTKDYTFTGAGKLSGALAFTKTNSGALIILTTNDYNGVTTLGRGTLQVGDGVTSGAIGSGAIFNDGVLLMKQPNDATLGNAISGDGSLVQAGTATLTLSGNNTFDGGLTISSGTLQVGNGGTAGSGNITNNSALAFNSTGNNTVTGVISGSGTLSLPGSGSVTFTAANTYSGDTVVSNGTLVVNGTNSGSGTVTVGGSGKLSGSGAIAGSVVINGGGTLTPGNPVGTLTISSNLTASSGAIFSIALGTNSDKVVVGNNLTLSGTLNITDAGGLGNATYTLFTYGGTLITSGFSLGTLPAGKLFQLDTSTPGQVNLIVGVVSTNVLSFPGAVGFGSKVTGGRGGTVYHITTLADSGTGSFRDAVSAGNRVVVFDVGGYITLSTAVSVKGNITIAGQTAPGGGIGFKGGEISFAGQNNIICRYIRVRPGSTTASSTDDALSLYQAHNIIIDHCSIEFAPWNNFDGVGDSTHVLTNITVMNTIIADPTGQQFGAHTESVGGTWAWYYNVFANSHNRNPLAKINTIYVNNVNYNYSAAYTTHTSTPFKHDILNNYFMCGPASAGGGNTWFQVDNNQSMYFVGNLRDNNQNSTLDGVTTSPLPGYQGGGTILGTAWSTVTSNAPIYSTASAYRIDASRAGTLPRDEMDTLIMNQVKTLGNGPTGFGAGTAGPDGGFYTTQTSTGLGNNGYGTIAGGVTPLDTDGDAMPDYWETAVGLNANDPTDATNLTLSGYSQFEIYLNWLGEPHAVVPINTNLDIDLNQYSSGFTNVSPVYTFSNIVNGTVTLLPDGHTARYTPPTNFVGRASFLYKVAGNDGTSMTNVIGLVVSGTAPPQNLTWHGDGVANAWNINTDTNWLNGLTPAVFHTGDAVTFDDSGSNTPAINLGTAVSPGSLNISANKDYTFSGAGSINGALVLNKSGNGNLTLNTANGYSSGTLITGGKVTLGVSGAIGAGAVNLGGGSVQLAGGNFVNPVLVSGTGTVIGNSAANDTIQGAISGSGTWNLNVPSGRVVTEESDCSGFSGTIGFTGPGVYRMNFNAGLAIGNSNSVYDLGSASTMNNRSATAITISLGALTGGSGSQLRGSDQGGSFTDTISIGLLNLDSTFAGTMQDGTGATAHKLALAKNGTGTLTLSGTSIASGGMTVSSGTLVENGISGTGTTVVASGATLAGTGTISGDLTAQSGSVVSPGISVGNAATLSVSNNLNLTGASFRFDLANATTTGSGVNDLISLNGGAVNLSGVSTIVPNYLNGGLTLGTYTLINGGGSTTGNAANLAWGGVASTRQTFTFDTSTAGTVRLQVGGSSAGSLVWSGTASSSWDFSTTNWLNAGSPDKFFNLDTVRFDDTSTNGSVIVSGTVLPTSIVVSNNALAYTFSGGVISGAATLQKIGPGTLAIASSNVFNGGTLLQGGTVALSNDVANQSGLGNGPITFNGGTLSMFSSPLTTSATTWNLVVPPASSGQINLDASCDIYGALTGSGQLNLLVPARQTTFYADWSAFMGSIHVATGTNGDFRIANLAGLPLAALDLASNVTAYVPIDPSNDVVVAIGELSGAPTSVLFGNLTESTLTWRVGGRNTDATFAGVIAEQSTNTTTAIEKTGSGTWTLTGNNSYAGDTHVVAGTLRVNNAAGNGTGFGDVDVQYAATLAGNGIIGSDTTIENGATLAPGSNGPGTLTFTNSLTLNDTSLLQFELGTNSDKVIVNGLFAADGVLNVTNAGGFGAGTYTLFVCNSSQVSIGSITLGSLPAGFNYVIDTNTPGQINLVVTSTALPQFGAITPTTGGLIFSGNGGNNSSPFYLLTTTNIAKPLNQWTVLATNYFDPYGNFLFTNSIDPDAPQGFYRLQLP